MRMLPDSTVVDPKKVRKKRRSDKQDERECAPVKKMKKKPETSRKKVFIICTEIAVASLPNICISLLLDIQGNVVKWP